MELFILMLPLVSGAVCLALYIYLSTRRGEKCPRYPYDCMYCRHSMDCIIEVGRKNEERRKDAEHD